MNLRKTFTYSSLFLIPGAIFAGVSSQSQTPQQSEQSEVLRIEREVAAEAQADSLATYEMLDDLVIESQRPVVKSDGATMTYSIEDDASAKGQSLLDVLRKVPGVTVDGQDNILVRGKSDYKIYVNGREEPMLSQNAKDIFKSMPSEAVARIEVITDPGAQFDAEGTAGILNLVTDRKRKENGYSGNINAGVSATDYNVGGFITSRINKVTAQVNLVYSGNDGFERYQTNRRTLDYLNSGEQMKEYMKQKLGFNYLQGGYKLSWEPNKHNLFTTSFNITRMSASINNTRNTNALYAVDGSLLSQSSNIMSGKMGRNSYSADASYQHNFDDMGHLLVASYAFTFGDNDLRYRRNFDLMEGLISPWRLKDQNRNISRQHTAQIDYTNPFGTDSHKLDIGFKGIFRRNTALGWEKSALEPDAPLIFDPNMTTDMGQFQDILAGYVSYAFTSDKWNARAGVRYENTRMGIHSHDGRTEDFQIRLNDVVPNASVSYSFAPATNLRLAYSMRISRPTIEQVNPFVQGIGYNIQSGNPDLKSERLNKVSLTYSSFGRVLGGSIGVDYNHIANSIEDVVTLQGLYAYSTFKNTGDKQTVGFRGFLNWNIIRNMSFSVNGDVEYVNLKAPSLRYFSRGWKANLSGNWNWRLENVANFGAFGGWGSPTVTLQGRYFSWHYYGVSVGRDFLKDKSLNVTLNGMNFFTPRRSFKSVSTGKDMRTSMRSTNNNWRVGVSISWRFGSLREQVKSTAAEIGIDDSAAKSSGNGQGGSGIGI